MCCAAAAVRHAQLCHPVLPADVLHHLWDLRFGDQAGGELLLCFAQVMCIDMPLAHALAGPTWPASLRHTGGWIVPVEGEAARGHGEFVLWSRLLQTDLPHRRRFGAGCHVPVVRAVLPDAQPLP